MFYKLLTTIAVTMPVFVLAAQTGGSDGIAIPLTERFDTDAHKFHATSQNAKIIRGPSGMDDSERSTGAPHPSAVQRDGSGAGVDLKQYMDRIWYGTISIGTPPRSFTVQLNTGSSDLFVPAITGDENCRSHPNLWDPLSSRPNNMDLYLDFANAFADGRVARGKQYWDNVTIAGFTAKIQAIGAATTYSSTMGASEFPVDGILGLAFPNLSVLFGRSPLLHTLFKEGKLSQPVFSLKLTSPGGELYIGGTNKALYIDDTLVFTPVATLAKGLWALKIDNIKVNGIIVLTNVPAVIDTGTHFILGDPQRALALHLAFGGEAYENGYYSFPCRSFPSMSFTISGRSFSIPANVLNKGQVETSSSQSCFSGIASVNKDANFWQIGTIFLQQVYTVFDFNSQSPRVGFAELMPTYYRFQADDAV